MIRWIVSLLLAVVFGMPGLARPALAQPTPIATIAIAPSSQGEVEVDGAQIHYEVYGEGEPLILLHGLLG